MNNPDVENLHSLELDINPSHKIASAKDIIPPMEIGIISINHTSQSELLVEGDDSLVKPVTFQHYYPYQL